MFEIDGLARKRSDLNPAVQRRIQEKEKYLDRKCRKIWSFTNGQNETFLFGSFCRNRESVVVTIASRDFTVRGDWLPSRN